MKNEPLKNEIRAVWSLIRFRLHVKAVARRERKERDRLGAGIFTAEEQRQNRKNWKKEEDSHAY